MTSIWLTELQRAKYCKVSFSAYIQKNRGKRAIGFGHCSSEEDILMPMGMMHSWEVCDMGWVLLQQKGPPCTQCWLCPRSPARACVVSRTCLWAEGRMCWPRGTSTGSLISTAAENQEGSSVGTFQWQMASRGTGIFSWGIYFVLRFPVSSNHKEWMQ